MLAVNFGMQYIFASMALTVTILVGTMTGTAQLCAQEMELALDDGETRVEALLMDGLDSAVFAQRSGPESVFLICTSTYGQGDVPDNARALYEDLCAKRPDLSSVRYGVFGLGDRTYSETFNYGGKRFDDILSELGATRVGERHKHDASSGELPEETAVEWSRAWVAQIRQGNRASA